MHGLGARQANIDYHLEMTQRCLAPVSDAPQSLPLNNTPLDQCHEATVIEPAQQSIRIAAKIIHLRNLVAALTPVPATTDPDPCTVFGRFCASFETLWTDRREHAVRTQIDTRVATPAQSPDPPTSRRSLDLTSASPIRHRRAGSSRI